MKLALCNQMRELDRRAIEYYKIPGIILMENAALSIFNACVESAAYSEKAVIFCGAGNNGGDGFALARHMANNGGNVLVILTAELEKIKGDARINYDVCQAMGIETVVLTAENVDDIMAKAKSYPFIVDALLGTGANGELRGLTAIAAAMINRLKSELRGQGGFVFAVDCPTGGNADNGKVSMDCVKADLTVTLALNKPGLLLYPLAEYAGEVKIGSIGAPKAVFDNFDARFFSLDYRDAAQILPARRARSHKGTYGKAVIVGGSKGMAGAVAYSARAAYNAGCGYVEVCVPESVAPIIQQLAPQAVVTPLREKDGFVVADSANTAIEKINRGTVCLIGPGLGNTHETRIFTEKIIAGAKNRQLIIDADAINAVSHNPEILKAAEIPPVITPHPLEMSRLTGLSAAEISDNIVEAADNFSQRFNVITILKDASTVISQNGVTYINQGACSALAKAGSGDILAGILAGIAAQGLSPYSESNASMLEMCALSAFIHSESGKAAARRLGDYSVSCNDIIGSINEVMKKLSIR